MASKFDSRSSELEIMDDLQYEGEVVYKTLRELEIINRLLGGNQVTINGVNQLLKEKPGEHQVVTIADLGCGGGDILKQVAQWGKKKQILLKFTGIDANPHIITYAKKNTEAYPEIDYKAINIFSLDFRNQNFDIVLATLFTHHFTDYELVSLFRSLKTQARIGVVVNDLHRHWFAYYSIKWLTQFFSKSYMVKFDAPLSVLRAFRKNELKQILEKAGITNYTLKWRWAFRWELILFNEPPR
jgi:2-polyprenyl-3-methyl-5-hydroxy-6-metoxy-1,4-benzoquinol methylase